MHCFLNELYVKISSCFLQQAHLITTCLFFAVRLSFFCSSSSLTQQALFFQGTRLCIYSLFFLTSNSHLPFPQHCYPTSSHDLPGFCWDKPSLRTLADLLNRGRQVLMMVFICAFHFWVIPWIGGSQPQLHTCITQCVHVLENTRLKTSISVAFSR